MVNQKKLSDMIPQDTALELAERRFANFDTEVDLARTDIVSLTRQAVIAAGIKLESVTTVSDVQAVLKGDREVTETDVRRIVAGTIIADALSETYGTETSAMWFRADLTDEPGRRRYDYLSEEPLAVIIDPEQSLLRADLERFLD